MGVKLNGDINGGFDTLYEVVSIKGLEKTRHILDTNGVCTHFFKLLCKLSKTFVGVNRACGVANCRLNVAAFLLGRVDRGLEVAGVVERVEDTKDIDTVCDGFLNEIFYYVIGVVAIAEDVLAAEKHLELGVLYLVADLAKSIPGVFVKETKAGVEGRAAPCFESVVADFIHLFENGKHFFRGHSRCDKRLVRVAEDCLTNFHFCHIIRKPPLVQIYLKRARNTPAQIAEPITPATLGPIACMRRKLEGFSF